MAHPRVLIAEPSHPEERALSGATPSLAPSHSTSHSTSSDAGFSRLSADRVAPLMAAHARSLDAGDREVADLATSTSRMHVSAATDQLLDLVGRPAATIGENMFMRSDVWNGCADRRAQISRHERAHVERSVQPRPGVVAIFPYPNEYVIPSANLYAEDMVDLLMDLGISIDECEVRITRESEKWQVAEIRDALARRHFSEEEKRQRAQAVYALLTAQLAQIDRGKAGPAKLARAWVTFGSVADRAPNEEKGRSERISEARYAAHKTHFQYRLGSLADVETGFDRAAIGSGNMAPPNTDVLPSYPASGRGFVAQVNFIGHGSTGDEARSVFYDFGAAYTAKDLREARGQGMEFSRYMIDGAKIHLEGCSVGKGELGRQYLCEVGATFLGEKSGTIVANTCESKASPNADEVVPCGAIEFAWPADCEQ